MITCVLSCHCRSDVLLYYAYFFSNPFCFIICALSCRCRSDMLLYYYYCFSQVCIVSFCKCYMHELCVIHWVLHVLCMGDLSFVGLFLFLDYLIVVTCMQRVLSVEADVLWVYLLFTTYSLLLTLYYLLFTTYSLLLSVEADVLWVYTISGLHGLVDPVPVSFFSTTYSLLLTLYYLLFTTYSLLLTLYYSLQYYLLFTTGLVGPVPVSFFSAARDTSPNSYVSFPVHITAHTHDTCILSMLPHILSILPHMCRT